MKRLFLGLILVFLLVPVAAQAQICIVCGSPTGGTILDFVPLDGRVTVASDEGVYTSGGYDFLRVTGTITIDLSGVSDECVVGIRVSYRQVSNAGNNWEYFSDSADSLSYHIEPYTLFDNTNILYDYVFSSAVPGGTGTLVLTKVSGGTRWYIEYIQLLTCSSVTPTPSPTPTLTPTPAGEQRALLPIGAVIPWAGNYTPDGWLVADGSCVSRETYADLYDMIGDVYTNYGTPDCPLGETCCIAGQTFSVPDLSGRVVVGAGAGYGLSHRSPGEKFGEEEHQLTVDEMPSHRHGLSTSTTSGGSYFLRGTGGGTTYSGYAGSDQPHNIMQPSLALNYLIWTGTETLEIGGGVYPTLAPTWTPEPLINVYSTVEAGGYAQNVAFTYQVTAGDLMVSVLLVVGIGLMVIQTAFRVWGDKR